MRKSTDREAAQKINFAVEMLQADHSRSSVIGALADSFGLSRRQAYRYLRQAELDREIRDMPEEKSVFTVKLPRSMIEAVRDRAKEQGQSIGHWVAQALEFVLRDGRKQEKDSTGK